MVENYRPAASVINTAISVVPTALARRLSSVMLNLAGPRRLVPDFCSACGFHGRIFHKFLSAGVSFHAICNCACAVCLVLVIGCARRQPTRLPQHPRTIIRNPLKTSAPAMRCSSRRPAVGAKATRNGNLRHAASAGQSGAADSAARAVRQSRKGHGPHEPRRQATGVSRAGRWRAERLGRADRRSLGRQTGDARKGSPHGRLLLGLHQQAHFVFAGRQGR